MRKWKDANGKEIGCIAGLTKLELKEGRRKKVISLEGYKKQRAVDRLLADLTKLND
jgi:hypothetical protein